MNTKMQNKIEAAIQNYFNSYSFYPDILALSAKDLKKLNTLDIKDKKDLRKKKKGLVKLEFGEVYFSITTKNNLFISKLNGDERKSHVADMESVNIVPLNQRPVRVVNEIKPNCCLFCINSSNLRPIIIGTKLQFEFACETDSIPENIQYNPATGICTSAGDEIYRKECPKFALSEVYPPEVLNLIK